MPRAADLGLRIGRLPSGPTGSLLDVPGVGVGHATLARDEPDPPAGRGRARTGVTVLHPAADLVAAPAAAGAAVLNGAGECTGLLTAREWGLVESPVLLTSTLQLGRVYDSACRRLLEESTGTADDVVIPVVAECDDSWLSDARRMQVSDADVALAWDRARASVGSVQAPAEGSVGAGTGMCCLGFKGGIGSASRVVPSGHVVGALALTNFGERSRLTVDGVPVGRLLPADLPGLQGDGAPPGQRGSCIVVVVTDAPLDGAGCERLARRCGLGLARTGSTAAHGSGEVFLAIATGLRGDRSGRLLGRALGGRELDPFFEAVVEATEEAVLTSLLAATTVTGRAGRTAHALPHEEVARLLRAAGRIS
ncbi:MAG TPA: P1 family peptidase [Jiangellales bacterium]|nr:P1 family peptidase [Jiangellales bacterium]